MVSLSAGVGSVSGIITGMDTVFIIEDDAVLREELARLLMLQGYGVASTTDFPHAAREALAAKPACVVLDLTLPGADGHAICRDLHAGAPALPIIMLTSSANEFDEVMALGLGACDYVTKPYRPAVLLARIQAALRKTNDAAAAGAVLEHEGVTLDAARATVSCGSAQAELTRNELRILQLLMRNAPNIVARQDIMYELWESDEFIDDNTLTVNVNRLRKTLESIGAAEDYVKTHRGIGYSL